jgi:hypothetical protein
MLLCAAGCAAGCVGDVPPDPCWADGPLVQVITADETRVARVDGDLISLVHGAQGGWHIEVGAQVRQTTERVALDLDVSHEGLRLAHGHYEVTLSDYDVNDCVGYRDNMLGIFSWRLLANPDELSAGELLDGLIVQVAVSATTESSGDSQEVELEVVWE